MRNKPLVSCITIFFNAEKFFEEAIESVLSQTYDNWELLLVDDGSTDGSTTMARNYAKKYPKKIRHLEHKGRQNRGMSATRNLGIRHAKGEYIAFIDADDVWLPRKLERKVAVLNSHPEASMVCGSVQFWYSWTGNPDDMHKDFVGEICNVPTNTPLKSPEFLILLLQRKVIIQTPSCILVRRDKIEIVGGFEESFMGDLQVTEDQVFNAKICLEAPVIVVREFFERYRQHSDSCCSIAEASGRYKVRLTYLKWLERYLLDKGVKDARLWKALRREFLPYNHPKLYRLLSTYQSLINHLERLIIFIGRRTLPSHFRHWLWTHWYHKLWPPVGWVRFGSLRRVLPISREFGYFRGLPIDRYYIEGFIVANAPDIMGRVLEIGDDIYTQRFGDDRVTKSDVLDLMEGNEKATIVGDLASADHILSDSFDCIILVQTLQYIFDLRAALKTLFRILKPGGVALVTVPGISKTSPYHGEGWPYYWHWSFSSISVQRLFEEIFLAKNVRVYSYGNVLTAMAFLQGLATEELRQKEMDHYDPAYPVTITIRAVKSETNP